MKKIKIILLSAMLVGGFLGGSELVEAECCIGTPCEEPSVSGTCPTGFTLDTEYDCAELEECIDDNATDSTSTTFKNPIEIKTVSELLDSILNNMMGLIVVIAVIFIIIGGILYMSSAGNETMVKRAKQTWTGATVGLAIALASPIFLKEIQTILGGNNAPGSAKQWVDDAISLKQVAMNVLEFLLSVFGVLAIIALVIGGGMYLTAYGDEKKIDSGKKIITYAIVGIVVALSALVVTRQIASLIGAQ